MNLGDVKPQIRALGAGCRDRQEFTEADLMALLDLIGPRPSPFIFLAAMHAALELPLPVAIPLQSWEGTDANGSMSTRELLLFAHEWVTSNP
jgi:hypothetical protein